MMSKMSEDVGRLIDSLESILIGDLRSRIIAGLTDRGTAVDWVVSLKAQMEIHRFHAGNDIFDVGRDVARLDARTRNDVSGRFTHGTMSRMSSLMTSFLY